MGSVHLALLRGINVGGKNRIPMKELAILFRSVGCENVRTFIQSGNVIFDSDPKVVGNLPELLTKAILEEFGVSAPVILRNSDHLQSVLTHNPFLKAGASEDALFVGFLRDAPTAEMVANLDPDRSPPDRFKMVGSEVYLHLPGGVANTKLTNAYFDSKLNTVLTARNWRTVNALYRMMRE